MSEEHLRRHKALHEDLNELVADFITHTGRLPSYTFLVDFMKWSYSQTIDPTEEPK